MTEWQPIETAPHETPVIILRDGIPCIGEKRTEIPSFEDTYNAFDYWDDPNNDGQCWDECLITHWMPLPAPPKD